MTCPAAALITDIALLIWWRDAEQWEAFCERSRARLFNNWIESAIAISDRVRKR